MGDARRPGYDYPLGDLIDFHCHILPGIDDGAKDINVSWAMIDASVRQGIQAVCFTPHFYADRDDPEKFFQRRDKAFIDLKRSVPTVFPVMACGAEIHYFEGVAAMEQLMRMRITGTDLLLIEMPFRRWTDRCVADIVEINSRKGVQVFLAHIERYLRHSTPEMLSHMRSQGVLIQSNADFVIDRSTRSRALRMLNDGEIDILASDSHNLRSRPQNLRDAYDVIDEELGEDFSEALRVRGRLLVRNILPAG